MKIDNCLKVIEKCHKYTMKNFEYFPLAVKEAKGSIITDLDDNKFIDFLSSASTLNLGSSHPVIVKAVKDQLDKFSQYVIAYVWIEEAAEYARLITSVYPGGIKTKIAYTNSGSEANDAAIKYSRAFTKRSKIIAFINSYHGTTYGSMSISGCTTLMRDRMGPFLSDVYLFPFYGNDISDEVAEKESTKQIEEAFEKYIPANEVAAVIIELVQGDAGILPAHPIFIKKLYNLCKKNGILFIVDDVQQGFFRTGKMFSCENYDIIPDGMTLGKSFGSGIYGSCFIAREEIIDTFGSPGHVSTYAGTAVSCAAGIAAFGVYYSKEFQELLSSNIKLIEKLEKELKEKQPDYIIKVRGLGMSRGIVINDKGDKNMTYKIIFRRYEKGLLVISIGGNVLRIQPPLNIPPELLEKGYNIINEAIEDYKAGKISDDVLKYKSTW